MGYFGKKLENTLPKNLKHTELEVSAQAHFIYIANKNVKKFWEPQLPRNLREKEIQKYNRKIKLHITEVPRTILLFSLFRKISFYQNTFFLTSRNHEATYWLLHPWKGHFSQLIPLAISFVFFD